MKKLLTLLILTSTLISCKSLPAEDADAKVSDKKNGMIVGTIAIESRRNIVANHTFLYANDSIVKMLDAGLRPKEFKWSEHKISVSKRKGDFQEGDKWIYMFQILKPEGQYKFHTISLFLNTGYMQSTQTIRIEIPFEVEPGKVKYLGEISLDVKSGRVQLTDRIERDRLKFKKFPYIVF